MYRGLRWRLTGLTWFSHTTTFSHPTFHKYLAQLIQGRKGAKRVPKGGPENKKRVFHVVMLTRVGFEPTHLSILAVSSGILKLAP